MATNNNKNQKASSFGSSLSGGGNRICGKSGPIVTNTQPDAEISGVNIPLIKTKDNAKQLSTYHAALQRPADDYLAAEDLDNIQLELETLLSSVALRYRVLKSEYESLDKDERRNERRSKHGGSGETSTANSGPTSSGKRKRDESLSVRKPKHAPASSLKHTKHAKNSAIAPNMDDSMEYMLPSGSHGHVSQNRDHHIQKAALPKNDTPNKFWLSVEPYCMPLTNEDIRMLDDLLEQYTGPLVPPIPELGPHYSSIWAAEDLKEIQQVSNPNANSNRLKAQNSAATGMIKKAESIVDDHLTGPLTQRLVSALLEEQLIQNPSDLTAVAVADSSSSSSENTHSSAQMNFRSLSLLRNCIDMEKRVKKELIEQGILDLNDFSNNEDEILSEIKRLIAELSAIAEYNNAALKRLHESAAEEIKRLEIKRKLDMVDQEILEAYKRTMQNKAKRKPLSTEDQHEIYRLTSEQRTLSDQLERIQAACFLYE